MHRFFLALTFLLPLLGCGKEVGPWGQVVGTISQDGKPVEPALVLFSNREAGVEMTAETDAQGRFKVRTDKIDGLPVGTYRVAVTPIAKNLTPPYQGMVFKAPAPELQSQIPEADREIATTRLTATVVEGKNDFTFELRP